MEQPEMVAEMMRRVEAAQADPTMRVGWVHDVIPHAEYGLPGVGVRLSWLDEDAQVTALVLWVPMPGVAELFNALDKLHSSEFIEQMEELGG